MLNRKVKAYVTLVTVAALSVLILNPPRVALADLPDLIGLALCTWLFEKYPISLPNKWSFSPASVFAFLAFGRLGWPAALLAELGSVVAALLRRDRPIQRLFNAGQLILSIGGFCLAAHLVGGSTFPLTLRGGVSIVTGTYAFFLINIALVMGVIHFASGRAIRLMLPDMLPDLYLGLVGFPILTLPLLHSYERAGWVTLLLFVGALLAFRQTVNLYLGQKRVHLESISHLTAIIERKSGHVDKHAGRVAALAKTTAEELKLSPNEVDWIHMAAMLHDVGEVEVSPGAVTKYRRGQILTLTETEAYQQHTVIGAQIVERIDGMSVPAKLIRHHHERWDGTGYPDHLREQDIPLGARILAAAEAVETGDKDLDAKLLAVEQLAGTVIDPALVKPLSSALRKCARSTARVEALNNEAPLAELPSNLTQAVSSSKLLENLGIGMIVTYSDGRFLNFRGEAVELPAKDVLCDLAERGMQSSSPLREHLMDNGRVYDVYCIPAGEQSVTLLLFDVTAALAAERDQLSRVLRAYRDVLLIATQKRLQLLDAAEAEAELQFGDLVGEVALEALSDSVPARQLAYDSALSNGLTSKAALWLKLCTAEATSNVFKHAGSGSFQVRRSAETLRVIIRDHGGGIPLEILPQAVLVEGYSTQVSLGKGFSVLLRCVDRLLLHTSSEGTTIILEVNLPKAAETQPEAPATPELVRSDAVV